MESLLDEQPFAPMEFDRRALRNLGNMYHVYEAPDKFTEVQADSAFEAMTRAQITKPFKISRFALRNLNVLDCGMLDGGAEQAAEPVAEVAENESQAEA